MTKKTDKTAKVFTGGASAAQGADERAQDVKRAANLGRSPQTAFLEFRIGSKVAARIDVDVTAVGLLAIGALVSGIIVSAALVVREARLPALG